MLRCGDAVGPRITHNLLDGSFAVQSPSAYCANYCPDNSPLFWAIRVRRHPRSNPHPCGYYGDLKRECRCGPVVIQKYRARISGPLLDRIDLHVEVPTVEYKTLSSKEQAESS